MVFLSGHSFLEYSHGVMWSLQTTERWKKDSAWYAKKRPNELAAVLRNLERFKQMLEVTPNPLAVSGGFCIPNPWGLLPSIKKGAEKTCNKRGFMCSQSWKPGRFTCSPSATRRARRRISYFVREPSKP
jgi:hypothetical protein